MLKRRIKNSQMISNVKSVDEDGLIRLKSGEYCSLIEFGAVDLSLTSNQEKNNFFNCFKLLFQIKNLNMKFYKLDERINLNKNKENIKNKINLLNSNDSRKNMLVENIKLIEYLEDNNFTITSKYYLVITSKTIEELNKNLDDVEDILNSITPKINIEIITNRLEIYKFLCNLYITDTSLDNLVWSDLVSLTSPMHVVEKPNLIKFDDEEFEVLTVKSLPPFIDELFFEEIFNIPNVRASISITDTISQEELINWVNYEYQFLLSDRNSTRKLSDATELDIQQENYQLLMQEIKSGDEKIKEVNFVLIVTGEKNERINTIRNIKKLAKAYQIKIDTPKLRQMELWQSYDLGTNVVKDYSFYLPTKTLSAGFPFTKITYNDDNGYMIGIDIHTALPIFYDPFIINNARTSHNIAIVGSTGSGKSFTIKKLLLNEYSRGTKIFIFDPEGEYEKIVKNNNGVYIDLYSQKGGIINPLQIRYISVEDENTKETDCPLSKHLGFLESFFKTAFESITEKELVFLLSIVEKLYNKKGIYKNTSINSLESLSNEDYPTLTDLYNFLVEYKKKINSKEKKILIEQLDILLSRFLTGTDSYLFDGYTNIDLNNNLIGFNLQELMYSENRRIISTQILNLLTYLNNGIVSNKICNDRANKIDRKNIMIIADEFHLFIDEQNNEVLKNFAQLARRIRKYSGSLVVSTQSIKDFVGDISTLRHSTAIFNNCQYQMIGMLKEDDLLAYLELFKQNPLTDTQKNFLLGAKRGEFLLNIDSKKRLRVNIQATELERTAMGEN